MLQVYGYIEEPKLLLHGRGKAIVPTALAQKLKDTQDGLLVAAMVALHENSKINLEEADLFFFVGLSGFIQHSAARTRHGYKLQRPSCMSLCVTQELCKGAAELESGPQLLVDFWEALVVASPSRSVIQELLFRLVSVYIDRIAKKENYGVKPLKTTDDLVRPCVLKCCALVPSCKMAQRTEYVFVADQFLLSLWPAVSLGECPHTLAFQRCPRPSGRPAKATGQFACYFILVSVLS